MTLKTFLIAALAATLAMPALAQQQTTRNPDPEPTVQCTQLEMQMGIRGAECGTRSLGGLALEKNEAED
ncbi:hypothetical protein [Pontivivens ytuae]|uniref:Uncharacterized protein n=1 Tax=Pontivivens ytuae TaxID=2789856 RepID=A0A7S9LPR4_9RHOB|nr:hypothetical protein [Pontivivens ytuae]QPH53057.1 hypothetical protein I0K15_14785 [Pontivivens ytuae]